MLWMHVMMAWLCVLPTVGSMLGHRTCSFFSPRNTARGTFTLGVPAEKLDMFGGHNLLPSLMWVAF